MYRIWCTVSGGITGSRAAWLKDHGEIMEFDDKEEAMTHAKKCMDNTSRRSSATFSYEAKEVMKETMVYNPYITRKPFCIIQENGERTVYDRDEIKELGQKYDNAASKAIIAGSSILIEV